MAIVTLLCATVFARKLGFYGVLGGLAVAEFIGMLFMIYAVAKTFHLFRPSVLLVDTGKVIGATAVILMIGFGVSHVPLPCGTPRSCAALRVATISAAYALALWPALLLTKFVTIAESKALTRVLFPKRAI